MLQSYESDIYGRGTASRQHWSDNLKFTQRRVDLLDNCLDALDANDHFHVNEQEAGRGREFVGCVFPGCVLCVTACIRVAALQYIRRG